MTESIDKTNLDSESTLKYLRNDIAVGDWVRLLPEEHEGNVPLEGKVVHIPHHRRYAVIRFDRWIKGIFGAKILYHFRECWPIQPNPERIAHPGKRDGRKGGI